MNAVMARKALIAAEYGIWFPEDSDLREFLHLSDTAQARSESRKKARQEGHDWVG